MTNSQSRSVLFNDHAELEVLSQRSAKFQPTDSSILCWKCHQIASFDVWFSKFSWGGGLGARMPLWTPLAGMSLYVALQLIFCFLQPCLVGGGLTFIFMFYLIPIELTLLRHKCLDNINMDKVISLSAVCVWLASVCLWQVTVWWCFRSVSVMLKKKVRSFTIHQEINRCN